MTAQHPRCRMSTCTVERAGHHAIDARVKAMVHAHDVQRLVICFIDLSGFARDAEHREDAHIAEILDAYYELVGTHVSAAGGRVVKVIGDGALLAFPVERVDDGVDAVLSLRRDVDAMLSKRGWMSCLVAKVHVGDVVCGLFGPAGDKRFDVIGTEVNATARLPTRQVALSVEAFRALSPSTRERFKKHTPPITYIPVDDKRPSSIAKS